VIIGLKLKAMSTITMRAADLFALASTVESSMQRRYWDKANYGSYEEQQQALAVSSTIYVGNLSYYTSEQHVYELARQAGPIKKVIMGLHRVEKTPCGFAFVEFFERSFCLDAEANLNGKTLEGRVLKIELDPGFKEGRQFGRGRGGGQVRDDFREVDDPDRGGVGALVSAGLIGQNNQPPSTMMVSPFLVPSVIPPSQVPLAVAGGGMMKTTMPPPNDNDSSYYDNRASKKGRFSRDGYDGDSRRQRGRSRDNKRYSNGSGGKSQPAPSHAPQVDEFGRDVPEAGRFEREDDYED